MQSPHKPLFALAAAVCAQLTATLPLAQAQNPTPAPTPSGPAQSSQTPANSAPAATSSTPTSAAGAGQTSGPITPGTPPAQTAPQGAPSPTEPPAPTTLAAGLDVYSGVSNLPGTRRYSDGFWSAGASLAYPSSAYLQLRQSSGAAAKVSLGTGDLYRGDSSTVKQPVELWVQKPVGKFTATVGKYYVPFALQEWQYETKYGVQLQRGLGKSDFAGSLNYDRVSHRPNVYFRAGRNFSDRANAGISLGGGKGLSYGSAFNRALGLDASLGARDFKLFSEALVMQRRSSDRFTFFFSKLVYDKNARVKPFVGYYRWSDKGDTFGDFRSVVYGATYQLRPGLLVEGGGAATGDKNIYWVQLHLVGERTLFSRAAPTVPGVPGVARSESAR